MGRDSLDLGVAGRVFFDAQQDGGGGKRGAVVVDVLKSGVPVLSFATLPRYNISAVLDDKTTKSVGHYEEEKFSVRRHSF